MSAALKPISEELIDKLVASSSIKIGAKPEPSKDESKDITERFSLQDAFTQKKPEILSQFQLSREIGKSLRELDNKSFVHFDLGLSEAEKLPFSKVRVDEVNPVEPYEGFCNLSDLKTGIIEYFQKIGNEQSLSKSVGDIIDKLIKEMGKGFEEHARVPQHAWVTIRASIPNPLFKIPRWHSDGTYFSGSAKQYKVAISLKGPSTLFCALPPEKKESFYELQNKIENPFDEKMRMEMVSFIADAKIDSVKFGTGSIFAVGRPEGAVHSEPNQSDSSRIFMSVVFANEAQIRELAANRNTVKMYKV